MRLLIRRGHTLINDLRFFEGPVYIGRQPKSQVFLPDRSVSRQHAVIYTASEDQWMIRDLDSANRTMVNGCPASRMPLHEGDIITISDFIIEVHFEPLTQDAPDQPLDLGDTIIPTQDSVPSVYGKHTPRRPEHVIHLAPARIKDFYHLTVALCRLEDQETLVPELNKILLAQLEAYHVWTGLRETTEGPLTFYGGINRGGNPINLDNLIGKGLVRQAMQSESYVLLPNIVDAASSADSSIASVEHLRSAMAAPIMAPAGAYGVIYLDNGCDQSPFTKLDLDYLTLVTTHLAALIEHIA